MRRKLIALHRLLIDGSSNLLLLKALSGEIQYSVSHIKMEITAYDRYTDLIGDAIIADHHINHGHLRRTEQHLHLLFLFLLVLGS
jgi:hypothetical protein